MFQDVLVSPVAPLGGGGIGAGVGLGMQYPPPPSPPSPGSMDDVPPPPPQPHYISTLRANSRRGNSPEKERDPLAGLQRFLRAFYRELAARDPPHPPPWAPALPPGALSPALFQPALRLLAPTPTGESAPLRLDQLLTAVRVRVKVLNVKIVQGFVLGIYRLMYFEKKNQFKVRIYSKVSVSV